MVAFFVPQGNTEAPDEQRYGELAEFARCQPLPPDQRIESITWRHDGEEWTATVGRPLTGVRYRRVRRRGERPREVSEPLRDPAMVLAIFRGLTITVVTDAFGQVRSQWANPFFASAQATIRLFDPPADDSGAEA